MENETTLIGVRQEDLESPQPEVRVAALRTLYGNACKVYGETSSVAEAERLRLEAAQLALLRNSSGRSKPSI